MVMDASSGVASNACIRAMAWLAGGLIHGTPAAGLRVLATVAMYHVLFGDSGHPDMFGTSGCNRSGCKSGSGSSSCKSGDYGRPTIQTDAVDIAGKAARLC